MVKILLVGYGNMDRQDDGIAWHLLSKIAQHFGKDLPPAPEENFYPITPNLDIHFSLQLEPETSEIIAQYDNVWFIDAHTGNIPDEICLKSIEPAYQSSPFTHHLTPGTCLSLCQSLYQKQPQARLLSIRGYEFGFSHLLSSQTSELLLQALKILIDDLNKVSV